MRTSKLKVLAVAGLVSLSVAAGSVATAVAGRGSEPTPSQPPQMQLPEGWTMADMQACMEAGTPGKQQAELAKSAGIWKGTNKMTMGPGMPFMSSECSETVTSIMDGRYLKGEFSGTIPGMGAFSGMAVIGFDNVSQKYVGTWIDSMSTGIMTGTGEASADGKVVNWTYNYNCPMTKKQAIMRQVETRIDENHMKLEMYMNDPKTGKEYKGMEMELKRGM